MKRVIQVIGMALLLGALLTLNYLIFDLGRYGTCATGGPYVSARECAPDTQWKMMGLFGAVLIGIFGAALAQSARVGLAAWGMLFTSLAITFLMIAFGPAAGENSFGVTAVIIGVMFLAMGIPGLIGAVIPANVKNLGRGRGGPPAGPAPGTRPPFMNG